MLEQLQQANLQRQKISRSFKRSHLACSATFLLASIVPFNEETIYRQAALASEATRAAQQEPHETLLKSQDFATCEALYFASENLQELLESLQRLNPELRNLRLEQLKAEFESRLRPNERVISNLALILLEALLTDSAHRAAQALQTSNEKGLPKCLRNKLNAENSARLLALSQSYEASLSTIHLHPLWHKDTHCKVALNGEIAFANDVFQAYQGQSFYIQKVCPDKRNNELLRASVPYGKEHLYVSPRASDRLNGLYDSNSKTSERNKWSPVVQLGMGIGLGQIGKNNSALRSGGATEQLPYKSYSFLQGSAQLTKQFSFIVDLASIKLQNFRQPTQETSMGACPDGFYTQFSIVGQRDFALGQFTFLPQLGLGVSSLVPGRSSFNKAIFIAPHVLMRSLLVSSITDAAVDLFAGTQFSANVPPFAGWTVAFLLGVQLNQKNTE